MIIAYLILLFFIIGCSPDTAGTTDTEIGGKSTIAGTLYLDDGSKAVSATVKFIPITHRPGIDNDSVIVQTTTNSDGDYKVQLDSTETYNLVLRGTNDNSGLFRPNVYTPDSPTEREFTNLDTLVPYGTIKLVIAPNQKNISGIFYSIGTDVFMENGTSDTLVFTNTPSGELPDILFYRYDTEGTESIISMVVVNYGELTILPFDFRLHFLIDSTGVQFSEEMNLIDTANRLVSQVTHQYIDNTISTIDESQFDIIFIFSSVDSLNPTLLQQLQNSQLPIVIASAELIDDLYLSDTLGIEEVTYGTIIHGHRLTPHYLQDSTTIPIFSDTSLQNTCTWATGLPESETALTIPNYPDKELVFTYKKGTLLINNLPAPGIRTVLCEPNNLYNISSQGIRYYKRSVLWSMGILRE